MTLSRRSLLSSVSAGAALGAFAPGLRVAFAADGANRDIVVVVYLRGAADGLQMISPAGDADYIAARPGIKVPTQGAGAGYGIATFGGVDFYVNPDAPEIRDLFVAGDLAVVHAAGVPNGNRSHFESQDQQELGAAPGEVEPNDGWLARHISALGDTHPLLSTVASSSNLPVSLLGFANAVAVPDVNTFNVAGGTANANFIAAITAGTSAYKTASVNTLSTVSTVQAGLPTASNDPNAAYSGAVGASLKSLARLIKMNVGVELATVDHHGWDQHNNLLTEFKTQAQDLSKSLKAFWDDLKDYRDRLTVVTMTEFGRRLDENESGGTDHGSASFMFVLGGAANGGKMYGAWPGLKPTQLRNGDLAVTTDYRQVLAEVLVKRQGQTKIDQVFPTISYSPLGVLS